MRILVTGAAGFIGSNLIDKLLDSNHRVIGIDDFNDFYDPRIKETNLKRAKSDNNFVLYRQDILNYNGLKEIFNKEKPRKVIHLAARAGVRPSIKNPLLYSQVNVLGTVNLLKLSAEYEIKQFIFASSSSVYGRSKRLPFSEDDPCQEIISPYGSSKRSAEFFVESFSNTHKISSVILRLFTVYGPRGRPDMAPALFSQAIIRGEEINQFGDGSNSRDYTYIDDITKGIVKSLASNYDFEIINLGNNHPVTLNEFISTLEKVIGKKAKIKKLPMQLGDVEITRANVVKARKLMDWEPKTSLATGLRAYIEWLKREKLIFTGIKSS